MQDPIQYVAKVEQELTQLIHDYGDYLFMVTSLLTLLLMALWRIKRPENLKEYSPQNLGRVLCLRLVILSRAGDGALCQRTKRLSVRSVRRRLSIISIHQ